MKKSIIKIGIFVLIIIIYVAIQILDAINNPIYEAPVTTLSENSIIEFSEDKVIVTDTYRINVNTNVKYKYMTYGAKLKLLEDMEYEPIVTNVVYDDKVNSIIVDEKDLIDEGVRHKNSISVRYYKDKFGTIWTNYLGLQEDGEHTLEITYEYDMEKVVGEYDDVCVINITGDNAKNKIIFPKEVNNLKVETIGTEIEKVSDNIFNIEPTKLGTMFNNNNISIVLEKNILTEGKIMDGKYEDAYQQNILQRIINNDHFIELFIVLSLMIISFIISCVLVKRPKFKNEYIRDTELLLDSVLSETLIDGKIGAKELIMTCILSAINKGAIEILNNDTIRLISYDRLNDKEKEIIDLIFVDLKDEIRFDDIKNIFIEDNIKTKKFYETFMKIKNNILNELFEEKIYNKIGDWLLKAIRIVSALIFVNIIPVFAEFTYLYDAVGSESIGSFFVYMNLFVLIIMLITIRSESKGQIINVWWSPLILCVKYSGIPLYIMISLVQIISILMSPLILIIVVILFLINYKTYRNSKKHMLTRKGKEEYVKILGLKKYIEDYSIMEKRDMEEVVLWDNYLVYATAFGIPNKITNRFAESLLNANINLQKINRIFKVF